MRWWKKSDAPVVDVVATEGDVERAYERGRLDERRRHRSHPILAGLLILAAVVGVGTVYLAAHEGSFSRGGALVDQKLANAADKTQVATQDAAVATVNAGEKVQTAGETLRDNSLKR